jgi:phosphoglucosamine mutase
MTRKYFGTDGIRGQANMEPITPATVLNLAMAAGRRFRRGDHRHLVVIGKDTRLSGYMLEPALAAGFTSMGMDVHMVGPMPTPAVAMLTRSMRADLGVVISASHNAFQDNGIKLFGPDGYKLSDSDELEIESLMESGNHDLAAPGRLGRAKRLEDAPGRYIESVKQSFPRGLRLDGLKIVVDCAHGAAYRVAPTVFHELGADVIPVGVRPDGTNINKDCGATNTTMMREQVILHNADLGVALDGDADRMIIADEHGAIMDGDQIMALIASYWHEQGRLRGGGLVSTVMSNLGLERFMNDLDLSLIRTAVGDRYVVEKMRSDNYNVGGEQSGHIILSDFGTTGDGLLAALQVLAVVVERQQRVSEVCQLFTPVPQLLRNVRFSVGEPLENENVKASIKDAEEKLGAEGRIVIRKSGTEPLIRVMAECDDPDLVESVVSQIVDAIEKVA